MGKPKSSRQLDAEIAHALAKSPQKPSAAVVELFQLLADNAEAYGAENLSLARHAEGYMGDPKEFRFSEIWARRIPDYKHTMLIDYIDEAAKRGHDQLGRKLTQKEAEWMARQASKMYDAEMRALRNL